MPVLVQQITSIRLYLQRQNSATQGTLETQAQVPIEMVNLGMGTQGTRVIG